MIPVAVAIAYKFEPKKISALDMGQVPAIYPTALAFKASELAALATFDRNHS